MSLRQSVFLQYIKYLLEGTQDLSELEKKLHEAVDMHILDCNLNEGK